MNSIELLLRAAEVIDRRETELCDHGYASSSKPFYGSSSGSSSSGSGGAHGHGGRQPRRTSARASAAWNRSGHVGGVRSLHNEMEKNRRANLRHCLERLKNVIPEGRGESAKNTTLQLLKRAKLYITNLENDQDKYEKAKTDLMREQANLNRMLALVRPGLVVVDAAGRRRLRSGAGSPASDVGSSYDAAFSAYRNRLHSDSASPSSSAESASEISDDVDIMGTGSDTDEYGQ